jgi:hypothetical protein
MSRVTRIAVLAASTLAVAAPVAGAARQANATEQRGVERAAHLPKGCGSVVVSTVDRRWASLGVNGAPSRCRKYDRSTLDVARKTSGKWRVIRAKRACVRPKGVPTKVWRDLAGYSCGEL